MNSTQTPDTPAIPGTTATAKTDALAQFAAAHNEGSEIHNPSRLLDDADVPEWYVTIHALKTIEGYIGCSDDPRCWTNYIALVETPEALAAMRAAAGAGFGPDGLANHVEDLGIDVSGVIFVSARNYYQAITHPDAQAAVARITTAGFSVTDIGAYEI